MTFDEYQESVKIAWIPYIKEWRDVKECDHGLYYCLDPGDGLGTHIEDGDGIIVFTTTEADCDRIMSEFEAKLADRASRDVIKSEGDNR